MSSGAGASDVVHGDELCIRDPAGSDRAPVQSSGADHTPPSDPDALDDVLTPVGEALFEAAGLRPGEAALDIGCGAGAMTLSAASAVGTDGVVHGVDITGAMLEIARRRSALSGADNVVLHHADAETAVLPESMDVAISRFGTMFFEDPVAAFTNVRRSLRRGGRLCVATWQPLEANAWLVIPGAALLPWIALPEGDEQSGAGMFSQSDATVLTAVLGDAGYRDIEVRSHKLALRFGASVDDAVERLLDTGVGRAALDAVPADQQSIALERGARRLGCPRGRRWCAPRRCGLDHDCDQLERFGAPPGDQDPRSTVVAVEGCDVGVEQLSTWVLFPPRVW
jgi:SAM-dependent methyltransferase